jgi:hypothetical protein
MGQEFLIILIVLHLCARQRGFHEAVINAPTLFIWSFQMYREEIREVEHCALNKDLFLQKPISTDDLIREINNKINSNSN